MTNLASTAIRYGASSRMAAALATAYVGDLIQARVLPAEAANLAVDGTKVQRAKQSLMGDVTEREEQRLKNKPPSCIMMDSRIDKNTLVMHHDEVTQKFYPRVEAEDHYTITDGDGKYLHHFTKELKQNTDQTYNEDADSDEKLDKVTDIIKPAEVVAQLL